MNEFNSKDILKIIILTVFFTAALQVSHGEWFPPETNPVLCDESLNEGCSTPINTGSGENNEPQIKAGSLILGSGSGGSVSLYVKGGRMGVGVGSAGATQALDVAGRIKGSIGLCMGGVCKESWPSGTQTVTLTIPSGSVVAFDMPLGNCPGGWSPLALNAADGKMIVGSNPGTPNNFGQTGGTFSKSQGSNEVAPHSHYLTNISNYVHNFGQSGSSNCCSQGNNMITVGNFSDPTWTTTGGDGGGAPMNITNPYKTLKYCKKN